MNGVQLVSEAVEHHEKRQSERNAGNASTDLTGFLAYPHNITQVSRNYPTWDNRTTEFWSTRLPEVNSPQIPPPPSRHRSQVPPQFSHAIIPSPLESLSLLNAPPPSQFRSAAVPYSYHYPYPRTVLRLPTPFPTSNPTPTMYKGAMPLAGDRIVSFLQLERFEIFSDLKA